MSVNNYFKNFFVSFVKINNSIRTWEHIKLGEFPWHNTLGFFYWRRSLKTHIEVKRELFM
jgi:hypothetical protein